MRQCRPVRHTLLSVSNKTDIVEFVQALSARGAELPFTGGIIRLLAGRSLPIVEISDYTGFSEMMDGCMKTLCLKVHGDILGRRGQDDGIMQQHGITPIDMVVVNLYPSAQTVAHEGYSLEDAVENIDVGDLTMVCSVAKSHENVAIVMKSSGYDAIINEMDVNEGPLALNTRFDLAIKTFGHTTAYDSMITNYFGSMAPVYHGENKEAAGYFPRTLSLNFVKKQGMRYGENSHRRAAFYIEGNIKEASVVTVTQLQGRALSHSNIADTDVVLGYVKELNGPAYVIVKHASPYSVAISDSILDAHDCAHRTGPTSAPGGIITFDHKLNAETMQAVISYQFVEVIIASPANEETLEITTVKQNVRILVCGQWDTRVAGLGFKCVNGGLLVQNHDLGMVTADELCVVSKRQSGEQELRDTLSCWKVAKFIKSNAIVYAKNSMTIGIGAGQMSHAYSTEIAGIRAGDEGLEVEGSTMASGTPSPFHDNIDAAAAIGITCVIQPGGSIRDEEVITAADEHGTAMIFTDTRHLRR